MQVTVSGATLNATHVLIATGSAATVPDLPGAELGEISNGFFALEALPKRVYRSWAPATSLSSWLACYGAWAVT